MPRRARLAVEGIPWHIIQRGNNRSPCFYPVRAGMVAHPADYPWSSYRSNGQGMASTLLCPHPVYRELGGSDAERCRQYRALFRAHLEPELIEEIRQATKGNYVLGDSRFAAEIEAMLRRRVTRGRAGRPARG